MSTLHVVALDVPYPPDYGVVIDVYYRLKALHAAGISVILHCFAYGREEAPQLNEICKKVYYYPRPTRWTDQISPTPYIVRSRATPLLLEHLMSDPAPILFDGLHTCFFLSAPQLSNRRKAVRMQNVEWRYYWHLAQYRSAVWKQLYYLIESFKLKNYESVIRHADAVFTVSRSEQHYYQKHHPSVHYLPVFHGHKRISSMPGSGRYVLYHGKLSVPENERAARLVLEVMKGLPDLKLIIAGRNPSAGLQVAIAKVPQAELVSNPSSAEMEDLIRQAHLHLLPTFQNTGIKHKLLNALFAGRHVVTNTPMVAGTGLEALCHIGDTVAELRQKVNMLAAEPFTQSEVQRRASLLLSEFDNQHNAQKLIDLLRL
ncbi:MAG: glycosyltransferase family 4 protein [Chitinophagales bacterium]|nr:glycosyltransferase family 4 protein [Chitinophagales bacterium]MDW8427743.1 glycosyltransferase family 4 protein [Chitinophagales bacterium]